MGAFNLEGVKEVPELILFLSCLTGGICSQFERLAILKPVTSRTKPHLVTIFLNYAVIAEAHPVND
jgi:hypothetical protein